MAIANKDQIMEQLEREFGSFEKTDRHFMEMWFVMLDMLFDEHDPYEFQLQAAAAASATSTANCPRWPEIRGKVDVATGALRSLQGTGPMMAASIEAWRLVQNHKCGN